MVATTEAPKPSRRKRRWGEEPDNNDSNNDTVTTTAVGGSGESVASKRKISRFSATAPHSENNANGGNNNNNNNNVAAATIAAPPPPSDPKARAAALQASIQARLAALKARTGGGAAAVVATQPPPQPSAAAATTTTQPTTIITTQKRPRDTTSTQSQSTDDNDDANKPLSKRAKVFELDMSTTSSSRLLEKQQREEKLRNEAQQQQTAAAGAAKPKEFINPYLAHTISAPPSEPPAVSVSSSKGDKKGGTGGIGKKQSNQQITTTTLQGNEQEEIILDTRLSSTTKNRKKSRPINFVAPGTYIALGEKKRQQATLAAQSGFISGRKVGNIVKSVGMGGAAAGGEEEEMQGVGSNSNYYGHGSNETRKSIVDERLSSRIDAPEIELEDYTQKKKIFTSISDINVEQNNEAIHSALIAATMTSSMPYAMEWWDAELLPGKLRKELAGEEGKAIVKRAKGKQKQQLGGGDDINKQSSAAADSDKNANDDQAIYEKYKTQKESHTQLIAKCYKHASLSNSKTHALIQHPVPILTAAQKAALEVAKNKPPTLHLTKAERKRHRKLRRAERLREQQDLQAAGLIPPPEPRLTLSNYMKVLGDQAVLDPSKMEAVVMNQIQSRKIKHEKMNAERKLTKEEKSAKHARKLVEDTSQSVKVALFYVKDMSHPYHRAKVDLNAQQNSITGGVLECEEFLMGGSSGSSEEGGMALVVAEGGEKAIKRYTRLMTVRMKWKGEDFYEEDDDEEEEEEELMVGEDEEPILDDNGQPIPTKTKEKRKKFNPNNECELIWSGMAIKRAFHTFMFQNAESSIVARKILEAKGVPHYWDLAVSHLERKRGVMGGGGGDDEEIKFRLG